MPPDSVNDLQSFLDAQAMLESEAREAMPFKTGECSFDRGYVNQSVWACKGELLFVHTLRALCQRESAFFLFLNVAQIATIKAFAMDVPFLATRTTT